MNDKVRIAVAGAGMIGKRHIDLAATGESTQLAAIVDPMPGAVFLTLSLVLYRLGIVDPLRLVAAMITHFILGWAFLVWAVFCLPPVAGGGPSSRKNPFLSPLGPPR